MTQEDKKIITAELNRRLKQLWNSSSAQDDNDGYYRNPLVKQLKELAVFVSDIKETEKPMNLEGLEKEIEEYFPESTFNTGFNYDDLQEIARHFAKWGAEHRGSSEKSNEPEERWDELQTNFREINEAFEAGKREQKEQMLKDAIPCNVFWIDGPLLDYTQEQQDNALERIGAHVGDKVKIIIVKEN